MSEPTSEQSKATKRNPNEGKRFQRYSNAFKGETSKMNGKVFQLLTEQPRMGQFEETLEALQRYANKVYPLDTVFLLPLFKDLIEPILMEPDKPQPKVAIKGGPAEVDEWDCLKYTEEMRLYLKTKERTCATMAALYGVAWLQCSKLMQNKCRGHEDFEEIEEARDIVRLLKMTS